MNERATVARRLAASLLDLVVLVVIFPVLARPALDLLLALGAHGSSIDTNAAGIWALLLAYCTIGVFYGLLEVLVGASPGKWMLRLRIVREDGQPASFGRRLGRYAGKAVLPATVPVMATVSVPALVYAVVALGVVSFVGLFAVLGPRRQTLYDVVTRTAVLRRRAERPEALPSPIVGA